MALVHQPTIALRDAPPRAVWALEQAGVHPLLARLFAGRGLRSADELDPALARLLPPDGLLGMAAAAALLADAIEAKQRLCVVADYDCDGATACAVALRGLHLLGVARERLHYVVPDRARHGYGLTPAIVDLALAHRPDVLITVDNGIASLDGVAHARRSGLTVLVTDHHLPALAGDAVVLPDANVIVNPNQPGCGFASKHLAGVGVMFYVLLATRAELRRRGLSMRLRNRAWMPCSTWWHSARWPTWCAWTRTTGASSHKACSASARGACSQAWRRCSLSRGAMQAGPADSTSASRSARASMPPGASPI